MKNRQKLFVFLVVSFVLMLAFYGVRKAQPASAACGGIIYVDKSSTALSPDGCSWAGAFKYLQDALAIAEVGDQIWVADGTYYPDEGAGRTPGDRTASFTINQQIQVYGGFSGSETSLSERNPDPLTNGTVLSGDIGTAGDNADNSYHIVVIYGVSTDAVLDGFTITGGNTAPLTYDNFGAGIAITDASPTLSNLRLTNNWAYRGGGIFVTSNATPASKPHLSDVYIEGNTAEAGGGMFSQNSDPILQRVVFTNNAATVGAGGGLNIQTVNADDPPNEPMLVDVIFSNNTAVGGGGLVLANTNGLTKLLNVTFANNVATRRGGALLIEASDPQITNVTFYNNTSLDTHANAEGGGALLAMDSNPTLTNVTFSGNNSVSIGGDAIRSTAGSSITIRNTILWDQDDEVATDGTGSVSVAYSIVRGGCPSGATCVQIINSNPMLAPLANNGGFTPTMAITSASPAWNNAANADCPATDQRGVSRPQAGQCDVGAYEYETILIAPSGILPAWVNSFRWKGNFGDVSYRLELVHVNSSTILLDKTYTPGEAGCALDFECEVSPSETSGLANGDYRWRIDVNNDGSWTEYLDFTVNAPCSASGCAVLELAVTPDRTDYNAAGMVIHYQYTLTNRSSYIISQPFSILDDLVTNESCPGTPSQLAYGESIVCSGSYTVTQSDMDNGAITSNVYATGDHLGVAVTSNAVQKTLTAIQTPGLTLEKAGTPGSYASVGTVISYTYTLTNSGNVTLSGPFAVEDDRVTDESCPGTGSLAPGASVECSGSYTVTQADLDAGSVTNQAYGTGKFGATTVTSNTASETVTAVQTPGLTLEKAGTPGSYVSVGTVISYTYTLTNSGNVTLSGPFAVEDDRVTDESCPGTGSLAPGASVECSGSYTVAQADLDAGSVTNQAYGTGKFGATTVTSNTASETVTAVQTPELTLEKTANSAGYDKLGDVLEYVYTITNTGNVTLSGPVVLNDDKADVTCPDLNTIGDQDENLDVGESMTCSGAYLIVQEDLDSHSVTNTAVATAKFGTTDILAQDTATVNQRTYTVTVSVSGNGSVNIAPPAGPYYFGQSVILEPVAGTNWMFDSWSGADAADLVDLGNGTWSLIVDGNMAVQAVFKVRLFLPLILQTSPAPDTRMSPSHSLHPVQRRK